MNAAARRSPGSSPDRAPNPRLILVVEDDAQVRWFTGTVLRDEGGYEVVEARHGAEALELLARLPHPPALVVTDVRMPSIDGRTLGRRLAREWPGLPVLYMAAYDSGPERGEAPLEPFVAKPYDPHAFLAEVARLLGRD
ncbi:MAG TPA: response regulator [Gemmatimonadales bacterium]|nr:response regulator [Gemmatimonadales bacterium]